MANIPGAPNALPGVFVDVETQSSGASIPGGVRVAAIIGEGLFSEVLVASALGGGQDGLNSTWTSTTGADGRHFALSQAPLISNRTQLFRNGILLQGTEGTATTFSDTFDYQVDITTGHLTMQNAHLVDQGGSFWTTSSLNVGTGQINNLTLTDVDAPTESWVIKCIAVQRTSLNAPIAGTAQFTAVGSVSGNLLDANGNPVVWIANNQLVTNTVLSFSIQETGVSPFVPGDSFTIKVASGVLIKNDSLTISYIPVSNLNNPTFYQDMPTISKNFGIASTDNNLTLGCQLSFANGAPGIMCVQAAPPLARRTSFELVTNFPATSIDAYDFIIPFPEGVAPDFNSQIHIFVTDPTTNVERQLLANKQTFFTLDTIGNPTSSQFIFSDVQAPGGWDFFYTVVEKTASLDFAQDGYINAGNYVTSSPLVAQFSSSSVPFLSTHVGKNIFVIDGYNNANLGTFAISAVSNGVATIQASSFPVFVVDGGATIKWHLINPSSGATLAVGTHGTITAPSGNTCTFTDATFNAFTGISGVTNMLLIVDSSTNAGNIGTYEIVANGSASTLTIQKNFVSEHNLKFELQDPNATSAYLVLNHNIVPNKNTLRVTVVDERDASFFDSGWQNALTALEAQEIDILVPLPKQTISVIFQNSLNHCITMSSINNKKERVVFVGAISGLTPDNITGAKLAAVEDIGIIEGIQGDTVAEVLEGSTEDLANYSVSAAYGNTYRAMYFYPDQIVVQAGGQNVLVSGYYIAAAAAGFFSGTGNIAMPLTNKTLAGFTILNNKQFSPFTLSQLANAGVTVLQPVAGGGHVIWGITTTQSGFVEEQEISIVFIRDRIAKTLRSGFQAFIGQPGDDTMIAKLSGRAQALLTSFISQGLITAYKDLLVMQDSVDPTQYDITVRVQPVYPTNFIFVKVSVGLL